jgi:hypothetical protein
VSRQSVGAGKWVEIARWASADEATALINAVIARAAGGQLRGARNAV